MDFFTEEEKQQIQKMCPACKDLYTILEKAYDKEEYNMTEDQVVALNHACADFERLQIGEIIKKINRGELSNLASNVKKQLNEGSHCPVLKNIGKMGDCLSAIINEQKICDLIPYYDSENQYVVSWRRDAKANKYRVHLEKDVDIFDGFAIFENDYVYQTIESYGGFLLKADSSYMEEMGTMYPTFQTYGNWSITRLQDNQYCIYTFEKSPATEFQGPRFGIERQIKTIE